MGAGKTNRRGQHRRRAGTGRSVSTRKVIEQRLGKPIERLFAEDGEAAFRRPRADHAGACWQRPRPTSCSARRWGGRIAGDFQAPQRGSRGFWIDVDPGAARTELPWPGAPGPRPRAVQGALLRTGAVVCIAGQRHPPEQVFPRTYDPILSAWARSKGSPPRRAAAVGLERASGDYPAYIGAGLLSALAFWPASVEGRRFLVTDGLVGRPSPDSLLPRGTDSRDHARRAVEDDRPRRDRVV